MDDQPEVYLHVRCIALSYRDMPILSDDPSGRRPDVLLGYVNPFG